jgi:hypothetical protein
MLSDELGQVVLLHSGMDDTHPITTPLSRAVVVKSRVGSGRVGSGTENTKFSSSYSHHMIESSAAH